MPQSVYEFPKHGKVVIHRLGKASILSPQPNAGDDSVTRLVVDSELAEEFSQPRELVFEQAGARQ